MHLITDSLLVGNITEAEDPPATIGALLFVAEEYAIRPPALIEFAHFPFREYGNPSPIRLAQAVEWIEERQSGVKILVCCRAGMGRSVSVVIAYLCSVQGMSYENAVKLAKFRRPGATPLPQLKERIEEVIQLRALQASIRQEKLAQQKSQSA